MTGSYISVCVCIILFSNLSSGSSANVENLSSLGMQFMAVTAHFSCLCACVYFSRMPK